MTKRILAGLMLAAFLLGCSSALAGPPLRSEVQGNLVNLYLAPSQAVAGYFLPLSCASKCTNVEFGVPNFTNYVQFKEGNMVLLGGITPFDKMQENALPANQEVLLATLTFAGDPTISTAKWVLPGQELPFHLVNTSGVTFYQEANDEAIQKTPGTESRPSQFSLSQNYPNPFNPTTTIGFSLDKAAKVSLRIYNVRGQLVKTLVDEVLSAGPHTVTWNAEAVSTGVYFYKCTADKHVATGRMNLLK